MIGFPLKFSLIAAKLAIMQVHKSQNM